MIRLLKTYKEIYTQSLVAGARQDPDAIAAVLWRNGTATAVVVTTTSLGDGRYSHEFTTLGAPDGWAETDDLSLVVTATIGSGEYPLVAWSSHGGPATVAGDPMDLVDDPNGTAVAAIGTSCNSAVVAGAVGTNVSAVKDKTDNLPASPAATADCQTGAEAALIAYDAPSRSDVANAPARGAEFVLQFPMTLDRALQTGLTVTGLRRHPGGGAFSALTNAVSEAGYGFYEVTLTAAEMDADNVALVFSATGADSRSFLLVTQ